MGLEIPQLDDRTYEEILADARKRIPVHADEWTDHNAHDPGITVLEVLAWVAEADRYRLDRVTDDHVRAYLALLGVEPEPPTPATARLSLDPPADVAGETLPADEPVAVEDAAGKVRGFETTAEVVLTRARVGAVVSDRPAGRTDVTTANDSAGAHFLAFGEDAPEGATLYVGFDGDPFRDAERFDLEVAYHDGVPEPASHGDEPVTFEPTVELAWQHCTDPGNWRLDSAWSDLAVASDETDRLYGGGTLRLERPDDWATEPATVLDRDDERFWLRCVVETADYEEPPRIESLAANVVPVEHRTRVEDETLQRVDGRGTETTARPDQTFGFERAPVVEATVRVGGEPWDEVSSFDASGPDDRHYVLDREAGTVTFGDERQGAIPEPARSVEADYVHGGGEGGNVSSPETWRFQRDPFRRVAVETRTPVSGGTGAERLDEALARLKRDLRTPYRAVTPDDYRYVATHTPGLRFGRATALVEERDVEGCETAKAVRVVVVPYSSRDRPEPSAGFLEAVRAHLERNRLLTDRVEVESPVYVGVGVTAEIGVAPGYVADGRTAAVAEALDEFLHPLRGYDGDGWPFGRPCYLSELYETVEAVEGIDTVFDVDVRATGPAEIDDGTVVIPDTALTSPASHDVVVRRETDSCRRDG